LTTTHLSLALAADHLMRLMAADSTSGREEPAVAVALTLAAELGLVATRLPAAPGRDNVLVVPPGASAPPEVVLCTHLDTVPPFIPPTRVEGTIRGRGACDAKGAAIAMLHALATVARERPDLRAACLLAVGEETDHVGARAFAAAPPFHPRRVILGEPCGLTPRAGQKGLLKARLRTRGTAAHSAYPELGHSAIHRLVERLAALLQAPAPADPTLGETTLNIGFIEGGVAANVLAPEASATLLVRCAAPCEAVLAHLHATLGSGVEVEILNRVEPIAFSPLPGEVAPAVPFNTDASDLSRLGACLHLLGPGDMRCAHGPDEHLALDQLSAGVEAYAGLLRLLV
jgi:acetylornithine deacetylase